MHKNSMKAAHIFLCTLLIAAFVLRATPACAATDSEREQRLEGILSDSLKRSTTAAERHKFLSMLAAMQLSRHDVKEARANLQLIVDDAAELDSPEATIVRSHLADCLLEEGRLQEALDIYTSCTKSLAGFDDGYLLTRLLHLSAACNFRLGKFKEANVLYEQITQLQPSAPPVAVAWAYSHSSDCLSRMGHKELASSTDRQAAMVFKELLQKNASPYVTKLWRRYPAERLWSIIYRAYPELPMRVWRPESDAFAIILCVHGLGLDSTSFEKFGETMANRGVEVVAMDVRGFGSYQNDRTNDRIDFDRAGQDIALALSVLKDTFPDKPLFLLGESMGGAICLRQCAIKGIALDGLICSVPGGDRYNDIRRVVHAALTMFTSPGNPLNMDKDLTESVSKDKELQSEWSSDPHARFQLSRWELLKFTRYMRTTGNAAGKIDTPVFMTQGAADRLVKPQSSIDLFNQIATPDKVFVMLGGKEHLIFELQEPSPTLLKSLEAWLINHSKSRKHVALQ